MDTRSKPQPVLVLGAITTSLTVLFGGLTLVAGLQHSQTVALVSGLGMLVTAAINAGKDFYVRGQVVPLIDTAAYINKSGQTVAGPAIASAGPILDAAAVKAAEVNPVAAQADPGDVVVENGEQP